MSEIKVNKISPTSGGGTVTLATSGDTIAVPSGVTIANSGTATGFGGGGILQVKTTYYTAQHTLNSITWAVFDNAYGVTITPTASNSTFWLEANVSLGAPHHDYSSSLNFFDSQVGTSDGDEIFAETTASSGNRHLGAFPGVPGMAGSSGSHTYALWSCHPSGLYTPASNNGNARTFYVCCRRSYANHAGSLNHSYINSNAAFAGVSSITVFEIANSVI